MRSPWILPLDVFSKVFSRVFTVAIDASSLVTISAVRVHVILGALSHDDFVFRLMCQCLNFVRNRRAGEMDERVQQRTVA